MNRQVRQTWQAPYSRHSFEKEFSYNEIWKVILVKYHADKATFTNSSNKDVHYICPYSVFLDHFHNPTQRCCLTGLLTISIELGWSLLKGQKKPVILIIAIQCILSYSYFKLFIECFYISVKAALNMPMHAHVYVRLYAEKILISWRKHSINWTNNIIICMQASCRSQIILECYGIINFNLMEY